MVFFKAVNVVYKFILFLFVSLNLVACVTTQAPRISHVHVGHAMTAWQDTPNEQGLFITAEQEASIAFEHAQYAVENSHDVKLLKMHIKHVQHTMSPEIVPEMRNDGPGLGYGFIKAIAASRDHILFAADSKDASNNVEVSAKKWSKNVDVILERSELIITLSHAVIKSDSHEEMIVLSDEIKLLTQQNLDGVKQLNDDIMIMIEKEDPPYQTVEKKYLFGLIRLPSGEWEFNFNKQSDGGAGTGSFQY